MLKFNEHPDSRQATKKDLVDIANALGRHNVTERLFSVPEIRASIRMRLHHLNEEGKLCEPHHTAPVAPQFTHAELMQLFHAIAQYVENHDGEPVEPSAESASEKLDAYVAAAAEGAPAPAKPKHQAPFKLTLGQIKALERLSNSPDGEESPYGHGRQSGIIASGWHRTIASLVERKLASLERYGDHYKARITTLGNTWLIGAGEAPEPQL